LSCEKLLKHEDFKLIHTSLLSLQIADYRFYLY
jgi:hypothetical protein